MSLERHLREPFFATAIHRMDDSVAGIVRGLDRLVQRSPALMTHLWPGSGWRTGSAEHSSGCAIDYILIRVGHRPSPAERALMMRFINEVLIKYWRELGIRWILFSTDGKNRTQSWNPARGFWKNLAGRGGISADHIDHVHILFHASASWPAQLDKLVIGGAGVPAIPPVKVAPGLPSTGVSNPAPWDGKSFPGAAAFKSGQKHAAVKVVQTRLKAHGFDPGLVDSYWGPASNDATRRFQLAQGWKGKDADGVPGPETWKRLLAAPKKKAAPKPKASTRTLKRGMVGDDVRKLQSELLRVFPAYAGRIRRGGGPNRNFGPATEAVVKEFQRRAKIKADGIVGSATKAALHKNGVRL